MRSPHNLDRSREYLISPQPSSPQHRDRGTIVRKGRTRSTLAPSFCDQWDSSSVRTLHMSCQTHHRYQDLLMLLVWGDVLSQTCRTCTSTPISPSSDVTLRPFVIVLSAVVSSFAESL